MARNRITLQFEGFEEIAEKLAKTEGKLEAATQKALIESQKYIAQKVRADMQKHHRSGDTEDSIVENTEVAWVGSQASIGVGFSISGGGLASIFLMYGTPRAKPDKKLYNDVYGSKTKKEIAAIQEEIFKDALKELE